MKDFAIVFLIVMSSLGIGNFIGDQLTIRDCATKGVARMAGGGTVICEIKRDTE